MQLSAGSKLEVMRAEEAAGNNKGGLEEVLIEYQKSLKRVLRMWGGKVALKEISDVWQTTRHSIFCVDGASRHQPRSRIPHHPPTPL